MMLAFSHSKEPTLGAAFVQWMNRSENQRQTDIDSYWLPTRKDLVASGIPYPSHAADMNIFISQINSTPAPDFTAVASPAYTGAANALVKEFDKAVAGQEGVPDCVRNLRDQVTQIIKC